MVHNEWNEALKQFPTGETAANIPKIAATAATSLDVKLKAMQSSINFADKSNLYVAPDLNVMVNYAPTLKDNAFVSKIVAPAASVQGSQDPSDLLARTVAELKAGTITQKEASAGIAQYYAKVNSYNYDTKDMGAMGITTPKEYNHKLGFDNAFNSPMATLEGKIDLANPTKVNAFLMSKMVGAGSLLDIGVNK